MVPVESYFFAGTSLTTFLRERRRRAVEFCQSLDPDVVLGTPPEDLLERLTDKFAVHCPELRLEEKYSPTGATDVRIDVSRDPRRVFPGHGPATAAGTRIEVHVPFTGDGSIFVMQPQQFSFNPPRGAVRGNEIVVSEEQVSDSMNPEQLKESLEGTLRQIEKFLAVAKVQVDGYDQELRRTLAAAIENRRQKVLKDRSLEAFLEVPVARRTSPGPAPILAVEVPKKGARSPKVVAKPFSPEPAITDDAYQDIVRTIASFGQAAGRFPETFAPMKEEVLREFLLVILNNQFGPAVGEMFSRQGKTDIAILHDSGPVFIAECKKWGGERALARAIDQLLSYLVWRDTKAAIVLFVTKSNPTVEIEKASRALRTHPRCKRNAPDHLDGVRSVILSHPDDSAREIEVALIVVPIPRRPA